MFPYLNCCVNKNFFFFLWVTDRTTMISLMQKQAKSVIHILRNVFESQTYSCKNMNSCSYCANQTPPPPTKENFPLLVKELQKKKVWCWRDSLWFSFTGEAKRWKVSIRRNVLLLCLLSMSWSCWEQCAGKMVHYRREEGKWQKGGKSLMRPQERL